MLRLFPLVGTSRVPLICGADAPLVVVVMVSLVVFCVVSGGSFSFRMGITTISALSLLKRIADSGSLIPMVVNP